ncbi:MAG: cysteine desulfurase family protein [Eubacteriales bacterium]|nr:cysteine desulfurase family protein [Eubacteriales bacterium]
MTVYLDNSATTRPCDAAVEAMNQSMREEFYNPSALYTPAMHAERAMENARKTMAAAVGCSPQNVIFTSGGTESDNLAIIGHMQTLHQEGELLYTAAEHAAVKNACKEAERRFSCKAIEIPLTKSGSVDLESFRALLSPKTALICVMQVCNETGVIMPLDEICSLRDQLAPQAAIHVDGVQGFLREPFSFKRYPVQSYAVSGHKIHGPKGVGALCWQNGFRFKAQIVGGGQQGDLRSGTENTVGIAGLKAAIEAYPPDSAKKMLELKKLLVHLLTQSLPETQIVGLPESDPQSAGHILSVAFPPVRAETLLHALEADGIYVGTGSACSSKKGKHSSVLTAMKQPVDIMDGAIRISLCPNNTEEEMRYTAERLTVQVELLRKFMRR